MYGEPFSVPEPLETVFVSWFQGGEVFRSGLTYRRGAGNIFYFRPGHETYPTYHDATSARCCAMPCAGRTIRRQPGSASTMPRTCPSKRLWSR
jgi:trehalose utilization protein